MDIEKYTKKTVSLFGKTRAFEFSQLQKIVRRFDIELTQGYDQNASVVIEGALIPTPLALKAEELYEKGGVEFIDVDAFEKAAAKAIEPKKLLMSLKLSNNQETIVSYLQNDYIDDELFLRLLGLYDFKDENFFENDTSRDITAALIRRFYKGVEHNHNIEYSNVGLIGCIEQTSDPKLIETLFSLSPVQKALKDANDPNAKLIQIIALHPNTPESILHTIANDADTAYAKFIASKENISQTLQEDLLQRNDSTIDALLAASKNLCEQTLQTLLKRGFEKEIAKNVQLTQPLFEKLQYIPQIAQNPSLSLQMQQALLQNERYHPYLAQNPNCLVVDKLLQSADTQTKKQLFLHQDIFEKTNDYEGYEVQIAANEYAPKALLEEIFSKNIDQANKNLSANPATPIDTLYQLSFDMRYAQIVKTNPAFGEYIKRSHAIGL